jgi:hypothetical protein
VRSSREGAGRGPREHRASEPWIRTPVIRAGRALEAMQARAAVDLSLTSDAAEFVRFCYRRRRVGWPELYDEMCSVASRGHFRGLGPAELAERGIGFSLFQTKTLADLVLRVLECDGERTKPLPVLLARRPTARDTEEESPTATRRTLVRAAAAGTA